MTVIDLETVRMRRVAERLAEDLKTSGVVRVALDEVDDVSRRRRAARRAGRDRGWRIRTGVSGGWAWAVSEDWQPGAAPIVVRRSWSGRIAPGRLTR